MKKIIVATLIAGLIPLISYSKTIGTYKGNICDYTLETQGGANYQNKTYKNWVLKITKFRPNKIKSEWSTIKVVVDTCQGEKIFEKTVFKNSKKLDEPSFGSIECPEDEQPKYSIYEDNELVATTDAIDNNVGDWSKGNKNKCKDITESKENEIRDHLIEIVTNGETKDFYDGAVFEYDKFYIIEINLKNLTGDKIKRRELAIKNAETKAKAKLESLYNYTPILLDCVKNVYTIWWPNESATIDDAWIFFAIYKH